MELLVFLEERFINTLKVGMVICIWWIDDSIQPIAIEQEFSKTGCIDVDGKEEKYKMRGIFDRIEGYDEDERIDYIERMGKQVVLWIINQIHQEKT